LRTVLGYKWAASQFDCVNVYLGDGPLLESTLVISGVNETEAPVIASEIAASTLRSLNAVSPITVLTAASSLRSNLDFVAAADSVSDALASDSTFLRSLQQDAQSYLDRLTKRQSLKVPHELGARLAFEYLEFEMAVYLYLARQGFQVDVYATGTSELPTLAKFIDGSLGSIPELASRSCIILSKEKDEKQ